MAFKKLDESMSSLLFYDLDSGATKPERQEEAYSDVEELDSSDSEYPYADVVMTEQQKAQDTDLGVSTAPIASQDDEKDMIDYEPPAPSLKRSNTYTKDKSPSKDVLSTLIFDSDTEGELNTLISSVENDNEISPPSGLKRSGTFTKEAPTVHVQRTRESSSERDSDSSGDEVWMIENSKDSVDTGEVNKDAKSNGKEKITLRRSGTFTKEKSPGSGRQRSGTFTKDKSNHGKKSSEEELEDDIDLDETLKASDFSNDRSISSEDVVQ